MRLGIAWARLPALLLAALLLSAQGPPGERVHRWKADLEAFARILETKHPAPFTRLPKAEFQRRLKALEEALPSLRDAQVAARWAALLGALGEEHTEMAFEAELEARHLPIRIAYFAEGAHIVAVDRPYRALLGARLERIGGLPLERIYEGLKPYVPHGQEGRYRHLLQHGFGDWPLLMEAAGLLQATGTWLIEGLLPEGRPFAVDVPILDARQAEAIRWVREPVPREPRGAYAFKALEREGALFIRLRSCEEDPNRPFKAFLRKALGEYRRRGLKRVVVDVRGNTGGSDALVDTLVRTLKRRLGPGDSLAVLIDGGVFSAGAVAAWRLRHDVGARLVGEACGAGANHVGLVEDFKLPSGRVIRFGTELHVIDQGHPEDFSSPIPPDREIRARHEDGIRGLDPVLAEALGGDPARIGPWFHSPRVGRCRPNGGSAPKP